MFKNIMNIRGFEKVPYAPDKLLRVDEETPYQHDPVLDLIFFPDPITGNPSSDLSGTLSSTNPAVQDYIAKYLRQPVGARMGLVSADDALDLSKDQNESLENYANRLRELLNTEK